MRKKLKEAISIILLITIIMNICPGLVLAETTNTNNEAWKQYSIFSANESKDINMSCWKSVIFGDMYTGKDFVFNGSELYFYGTCSSVGKITTNGWKMNITERDENVSKIEMPQLGDTIKEKAVTSSETYCTDKSFNANEINLSEPIISDGEISFNGTQFSGEGYVIAKDSITYNVSWLDTGDDYYSVLYSENGDIIINGSSITINGILYAPNGKVQFNVSTLNLNGRIIADNIVFSGSQFNINGNDGDWDWVTDEKPIIRTYTSTDDFDLGKYNNAEGIDDKLRLSSIENVDCSSFEKQYSRTDSNGIGIQFTQKYDKDILSNKNNNIKFEYGLSGIGELQQEENAVDIVIVLDESGSMNDYDRYENSINAIRNVIASMKNGDRCGLVTFHSTATVHSQLESDKDILTDIIDNYPKAGGGTSIGSGIKEALTLFEENNRRKAIFLLSDGQDGDDIAVECAKEAGNYGIQIFSIGIGSGVNREQLENIAIESKGIYKYSSDGQDINDLLLGMTTEVFNVAGQTGEIADEAC